MTASSRLDPDKPYYLPRQARLNLIPEPLYAGGWCAEYFDTNQWIQVDFGASKVVSAIVLQGQKHHNNYVTKYKVQYSDGEDLLHLVKYAHNDTVTVRSL